MNSLQPTYRLLVVDDQLDLAESLRGMLEDELGHLGKLEIEVEESFDKAEQRLEVEPFDIVVLDVQLKPTGGPAEEHRGRELYSRIAEKRWLPVVFCTAWPERVRELEKPPLITVVNKSHLEAVVTTVRTGLDCGIPALT